MKRGRVAIEYIRIMLLWKNKFCLGEDVVLLSKRWNHTMEDGLRTHAKRKGCCYRKMEFCYGTLLSKIWYVAEGKMEFCKGKKE